MQAVSWYFNRLKSMSVGEIVWRVDSLIKASIDQAKVSAGHFPVPKYQNGKTELSFPGAFRVSDASVGCGLAGNPASQWLDSLSKKADSVADGRLSFFNLVDVPFDSTADWQKDLFSHKEGTLAHINQVDYRDFKKFGDCKLVWEPNRHHQFVVLGRAYRASGDEKYARALVEQLQNWIAANPYGRGMNWKSPLELGIRLINWVWALDLISESEALGAADKKRISTNVYWLCRDIERKLSKGSSANNHLVGEAAGLYIASSYFQEFADSSRWQKKSQEILESEIIKQSFPEGCTREHALGYQFFVIQFYLFSGLTGKKIGAPFSQDYWSRLEKLYEFVGELALAGGSLPMFGDKDDGYVLDLGDPAGDVSCLMQQYSLLFGQSRFNHLIKRPSESVFWLMDELSAPDINENPQPLQSKRFEESGYVLLQSGEASGSDQVSLFIDVADLGYGSIAAHGNADALHFNLKLGGKDCLIDTGTYDYFTFPEWRNYFRSTQAHNVVEIDGEDQSEMQGPFLWGQRALTQCELWEPNSSGGTLVASHSGYEKLSDPVVHRRTFGLDAANKKLTIIDEFLCEGAHDIKLHFHLAKSCAASIEGDRVNVSGDCPNFSLRLDEGVNVRVASGDEQSKLGWASDFYHQKHSINVIVAEKAIVGTTKVTTVFDW